MPVYRVVRKDNRKTAYAYAATTAVEFPEYPFDEFDHIEEIGIQSGGMIPPDAPRIVTKLEYLRRFTQTERITIRTAAEGNAVLADYLAMLELAEDINMDDPDTVGAVQMLEAVGLIGTGRAAEVLA